MDDMIASCQNADDWGDDLQGLFFLENLNLNETQLCKLMDATVTPAQLFERIQPGFSHKNSRVREEVLLLLQNTLNAHGAGQLTVSKLIPSIVTCSSDPQAAVRDAAIQTLVEIYR